MYSHYFAPPATSSTTDIQRMYDMIMQYMLLLTGMFQRWISDRVFSKEEAAVHCVDLLATSFDAV